MLFSSNHFYIKPSFTIQLNKNLKVNTAVSIKLQKVKNNFQLENNIETRIFMSSCRIKAQISLQTRLVIKQL